VLFVAPGTTVVFTLHWNPGDCPPFKGATLNVTGFPAQEGLADAEMLMPTKVLCSTHMFIMAGVDAPSYITLIHCNPASFQVTVTDPDPAPPVIAPPGEIVHVVFGMPASVV
jgi:hypothetical protein